MLDDRYDYDPNGNVAKITDLVPQGTGTRTMTYDDLDRLETVSAPALWGKVTYGYDALDNLTATTMSAGPNARSAQAWR